MSDTASQPSAPPPADDARDHPSPDQQERPANPRGVRHAWEMEQARRRADHAIGRVFATLGAISSVTFGLSLLAASAALQVIAPRTLGALAGGLIVCAGLTTLAGRVRQRTPTHASAV